MLIQPQPQYSLFAGCKESQFYSLPFEQAVASINLLAQKSFQLAP